jgi:hypothetical protein
MTPTPKIMASIYIMLCNCKPFDRWKLPYPEEIKFVVTNDEDALGTYIFDEEIDMHVITISKAKCGHLDTLIKTLAHEVIHMTRGKTSKYGAHDDYFKRKASSIALELGFDPLEL